MGTLTLKTQAQLIQLETEAGLEQNAAVGKILRSFEDKANVALDCTGEDTSPVCTCSETQ
jgi:hypothetical protein